jgi:hypothetical protein
MIAVPWFARDQLAVAMDEKTRVAQQVMQDLESAEARAQQDSDQRQNADTLRRIEAEVSKDKAQKADKEVMAYLKSLQAEAEAQARSAETLAKQLALVDVKPLAVKKPASAQPAKLSNDDEDGPDAYDNADENKLRATLEVLDKENFKDLFASPGLKDEDWQEIGKLKSSLSKLDWRQLAENVHDSAIKIAHLGPDLAAAQAAEGTLEMNAWAINYAYEQLNRAAEAERKGSATAAKWCRWIAWLFTVVGGYLMYGDTSKLLRGPEDESDAEAEGEAAA